MNEKDNGTAQSSVYPVRPGQKDCDFYLKTGQCGYRDCRYNHPKDIPPVKFNMPKCKYFLKGYCKHGSDCVYDHSWERDVAEHMRQAKTILGLEKNLQEQRQVNVEKQRIESLRETQENHNDEQNLEEQRKRDIERQRREARLRTEQIKQTVHFDDAIRVRKLLTELGIILTEGDGF